MTTSRHLRILGPVMPAVTIAMFWHQAVLRARSSVMTDVCIIATVLPGPVNPPVTRLAPCIAQPAVPGLQSCPIAVRAQPRLTASQDIAPMIMMPPVPGVSRWTTARITATLLLMTRMPLHVRTRTPRGNAPVVHGPLTPALPAAQTAPAIKSSETISWSWILYEFTSGPDHRCESGD